MTPSNPPTLDTGTRLAIDRTRLAYERTMMAWIRTAASLISFGFTIYKFFQLELKGPVPPQRLIGPRGFALLMIGTGLVALLPRRAPAPREPPADETGIRNNPQIGRRVRLRRSSLCSASPRSWASLPGRDAFDSLRSLRAGSTRRSEGPDLYLIFLVTVTSLTGASA